VVFEREAAGCTDVDLDRPARRARERSDGCRQVVGRGEAVADEEDALRCGVRSRCGNEQEQRDGGRADDRFILPEKREDTDSYVIRGEGVGMAELTHLEEKLAEVTGLAMAAEAAGGKVTKLTEEQDAGLVATLQKMAKEAAETVQRCEQVAGTFEGKKTAILDEAREVKKKAAEMMSTYLDKDAEALDGFEFLTMAEAAEVGHWSVLETLNESAGNNHVRELVSWALPIQKRHFDDVLQGSQKLAAEEDPNETS
jgi:hypothetical protein